MKREENTRPPERVGAGLAPVEDLPAQVAGQAMAQAEEDARRQGEEEPLPPEDIAPEGEGPAGPEEPAAPAETGGSAEAAPQDAAPSPSPAAPESTGEAEADDTRADEAGAAPAEPGEEDAPEDEDAPDGPADPNSPDEDTPADANPAAPEEPHALRLGRLAKSLVAWLGLVALALVVLLGASLALLYTAADEESIPALEVSLEGQALEPTAYHWQVPVAGPIARHFDWESAQGPQQLENITVAAPALTLGSGFEGQLTVQDQAGQEVFSGGAEAFAVFAFEADGQYTARLTATRTPGKGVIGHVPQGSYQYDFAFRVGVVPQLEISRETIAQGSLLSLRLTGALSDTPPRLKADFAPGATFAQRGRVWLACLDVPYDCETGDYTIQVVSGDSTLTRDVHIYARQVRELDTSTLDGTAAVPYIGAMPDALAPYMEIADPDAYWTTGFVQPVRGALLRDYDVLEYTDRITDPALIALVPDVVEALNAAIVPRLSLNVTMTLPGGTPVQCPADGRVIYTGVTNGGGNTLVIEHGCGLKSIFYLLRTVAVAEGDTVCQGDSLGTANDHIVCEMRLNGTPINPWELWRNQSGLFTF